LASPGAPKSLRIQAINSTYVDLSHELAAGSSDALQLNALLQIVENCQDDQVVAEAASRLYFVIVQQPRGVYYCPEIILKLETREQMDKVTRNTSFVSQTLNNLALAGRRNMAQLMKNYPNAVVRAVPPLGSTPVEERVRQAARR